MNTRNAAQVANEAKYYELENGNLCVENAAILWTNFAGAPDAFNPNGGKRSFNLVLSHEMADVLSRKGWNVKFREPSEEGDLPLYFTEIVIKIDSQYPPEVILKTVFNGRSSVSRLNLDDTSDNNDIDLFERFDTMRLTNICLSIKPYNHGRTTASGTTVKGYCNSFCATNEPEVMFSDYLPDDGEVPFE